MIPTEQWEDKIQQPCLVQPQCPSSRIQEVFVNILQRKWANFIQTEVGQYKCKSRLLMQWLPGAISAEESQPRDWKQTYLVESRQLEMPERS